MLLLVLFGGALAAGGLLGFCILPIAGHLLPRLFEMPQPLPIAINLIEATGFALLGVGLQLAPQSSRSRVLLAVLAILAGFFVLREPISRLIVGQRYAALPGGKGQAHVMQGSSQTCAAACATTILRSYGLSVSEGEMATRCRTSFFGTSNFGLIRGMREAAAARQMTLTCEVRIRLGSPALLDLPTPAILTVEVNGMGHAVVLLGRGPQGRTLLIGDPLEYSLRKLTPEELDREYKFSGDVLLIKRVPR